MALDDPTITRANQRTTNTTQPTSSPTGLRPGGFGSNGPVTQPPDTTTTPSTSTSGTYPGTTTPQPGSGGVPAGSGSTTPIQGGTKNPDGSTSGTIPMPQVDNTKLSNDFNDIAKSLPNNALSNDNKDHTGIDQLKNSLQQKGYITQDGPTDEYGRRDSLYINGVLYRVNDSQGNWKLVSNANGDAWGGGGAGGAGSLNGQAGSSFGDISSMFTSGRDPRSNDLYNMLMSRASQSLALDPKDPIIANQVNAFGAQQTRGARDYIDQLAESEGPDANLGAERRLSSEHAAQATGSLQASLMQNELTARRGEITQALQEMGTLLTADQQLALQKELGEINAMLASGQLGLDSQNWANRWNWLNSTGTPPGI